MTAKLPLDDIRVIDLTVARAGPTCVRQLADWGAGVVRVEWLAHPAAPGVTGGSRHGADFQHLHRNKRSLSLNLKAPAAREVLMRLVDVSDVLIENMRPPVKYRLGFDFETVHARNPRLVYGSLSGLRRDGPAARGGGGGASGAEPRCRAARRPGPGSPWLTCPPACTSRSACWSRCMTGSGPAAE